MISGSTVSTLFDPFSWILYPILYPTEVFFEQGYDELSVSGQEPATILLEKGR